MSDPDYIVDFGGHKLDVQELVNQPFLEHMKLIDAFVAECGLDPKTAMADPVGKRFVALIKPVYWRLRRERMKRMEAIAQ